MKIKVDRLDDDGNAFVEEHDVEFDIDSLTMREAVTVETMLGEDKFNKMLEGEVRSPAVIQAVLYAKLKTRIPDLTLESFDIDLSEFAQAVPEQGSGKE